MPRVTTWSLDTRALPRASPGKRPASSSCWSPPPRRSCAARSATGQTSARRCRIAGSFLETVREITGPLYAQAGVPEYWIVDLAGGQIEVHSEPRDGRYERCDRYGHGASVRHRLLAVTIAVDDVLPRR